MAILLIPIFFVSLVYIVLGFRRVKDRLRLGFVCIIGLLILGITFPLVMVVFNGMTGGYIENELSILWSSVELLTIQSGDVYMSAGGLILVVAATILLVLQIALVGKK